MPSMSRILVQKIWYIEKNWKITNSLQVTTIAASAKPTEKMWPTELAATVNCHHDITCWFNTTSLQNTCKSEYSRVEFIKQYNRTEYWWNVPIRAAVKVRNNKPDLILGEIENKNCHILKFSYPADVNVTRKATEKLENYGPLLWILQLTHPNYKFSFELIIIGIIGTVPKDLHENIGQFDINKKESNDIIKSISTKTYYRDG